MTNEARAKHAAAEVESDVGRCCGDNLNLTGEELAGVLAQFGAAAQAAQRAADAGRLDVKADKYMTRDGQPGPLGLNCWGWRDIAWALRAEAENIRASGPPAAECVLCARDGGHACACDPQPPAEPGA